MISIDAMIARVEEELVRKVAAGETMKWPVKCAEGDLELLCAPGLIGFNAPQRVISDDPAVRARMSALFGKADIALYYRAPPSIQVPGKVVEDVRRLRAMPPHKYDILVRIFFEGFVDKQYEAQQELAVALGSDRRMVDQYVEMHGGKWQGDPVVAVTSFLQCFVGTLKTPKQILGEAIRDVYQAIRIYARAQKAIDIGIGWEEAHKKESAQEQQALLMAMLEHDRKMASRFGRSVQACTNLINHASRIYEVLHGETPAP